MSDRCTQRNAVQIANAMLKVASVAYHARQLYLNGNRDGDAWCLTRNEAK